MNHPRKNNHHFTSQKSTDILLDLFLEETLGEVGCQQDDWSDGITGLLQEEEAAFNRKAAWDYFSRVEQCRVDSGASRPRTSENVLPFPVAHHKELALSA